MVWKTDGDDVRRKYDFAYDAANRLMKSQFEQDDAANAWNSTTMNYAVQMGDGITPSTAYDDNGNIKAMKQFGWKLGGNPNTPIDYLRYTYTSGSNKLKSVLDFSNDAASKLGDFKTIATHPYYNTKAGLTPTSDFVLYDMLYTDYYYDANGNMVSDANKAISSIIYNTLNLPKSITITGKGTLSYTYDASGNKLRKQTVETGATVKVGGVDYSTNITSTTTYLAGSVYESKSYSNATVNASLGKLDMLQFLPQEEGRIRLTEAVGTALARFDYDYMLKDHLGNVRMVLTEEIKTDQYPAATMETANSSTENALFYNIDNTRFSPKPSWFADPVYTTNSSVARVKNASGYQNTGPGILLKVMAGDSYNIRVASGWTGANPTVASNTNVLAELFNLLTGSLAGQSGGKITQAQLQNTSSGLNSGLSSFLAIQSAGSQKPKASLNWILFDEQFKVVLQNNNSSFNPITLAANTTQIHTRVTCW